MTKLIYLTITFLSVFVLSYLGVKGFRQWSLSRNLFDIPNERSSHTTPTPRGGGIVIVLISLVAYAFYTTFVGGTFSWAYLLGAALIAAISWLDDLYNISFIIRISVHASAAALIVYFVGYFDQIYLPVGNVILRSDWIGLTATFLGIVWLTNAFNFMDGIDGIAGMQALTAGIGWALIGWHFEADTIAFYGSVIASTAAGFLILNWQPAKIFMGDVGSAFLGFTFAVLPILTLKESISANENSSILPWIAILLNWLFIFDTVFTFFKRILKREKIWEAHRSHLYQQLVISGYSHRTVTTIYAVLSILIITSTIFWTRGERFLESWLIFSVVLPTIGLLLLQMLSKSRQENINER